MYSKDFPQLIVTLWLLRPQEEDSPDCCRVERGRVVTVRHLEEQIWSSALPVLCHTYKGITLHFQLLKGLNANLFVPLKQK